MTASDHTSSMPYSGVGGYCGLHHRHLPCPVCTSTPPIVMTANSEYDRVLADLNECRRLKAWRRVPVLEAELERLRPRRVELAQDSYYYGTAADFSTPPEEDR